MKRKLMLVLLTVVAAFCCVFAFAACSPENKPSDKTDEKPTAHEHDFTNGDCQCGAKKPTDGLKYELSSDWGRKTYICTGLGTATDTDIVIADSIKVDTDKIEPVTGIGSRAFYGCSGLTSITIPDSVTFIGLSAFYGCSGLTSINYTGDIAGWCAISGLGSLMRSDITLYIDGKEVTGELIIPDSVTSITESAFSGCSGLTSITIGNSVTTIGELAFGGCSGLTSITIPDSVFSIGFYAFYGCSRLTSITIPDSVVSIYQCAFGACSGLISITIPDSVTTIGELAFGGCRGLTSIAFDGTKAQWKDIQKGSRWNIDTGEYTVHCTDGDLSKIESEN